MQNRATHPEAEAGADPLDQARWFVVLYRRGPNWIAGKPMIEQPIAAHYGDAVVFYDAAQSAPVRD